VAILMAVNLIALGLFALALSKFGGWLGDQAQVIPPSPTTPIPGAPTITASITPSPTTSVLPSPLPPSPSPTAYNTPNPLPTLSLSQGVIILSLDEGGDTHLFVYQPQSVDGDQALPLTRLTHGPWDDISPALNPEGTHLAFASNRSGYWDLYLLELSTGIVTRLTDSLEYENAPSWSPDGRWLVYETYIDEEGEDDTPNLELVIRSVWEDEALIRLTRHPAGDHSPTWSPQGRKIAFVSNRDGDSEVWVADLDKGEDERFQNISQNSQGPDTHPVWSPDGSTLAWAGVVDGFHQIYVLEFPPDGVEGTGEDADPELEAEPRTRTVGSGDWPAWSPDGNTMLTVLFSPNRSYLSAYLVNTSGLTLQPLALPGPVEGIIWADVPVSWPLRDPYKQAAQLSPTPLWYPALTSVPQAPGERYQLVELEDVEAPHPLMHDLVDESFQALRQRLAPEIGWDFLSTLENAFVPLTSPLSPGMGADWLYTGRSFAITTLPMNANWLAVVREDFGSQTYWRIYLRARFQDGSAGRPLRDQPWDFNSRYGGDTTVYEQGGKRSEMVPPGYWLDFTRLAMAYSWERLPALSTWRAAYTTSRFNEFANTGGMDWHSAMLEIYPPEVLITPSPFVPPTRTLTPTPRWYQTPTPTFTPTPRPTFTPITPTGTSTPVLTSTPFPSSTPLSTATLIEPTSTATEFNPDGTPSPEVTDSPSPADTSTPTPGP
jgi:TolB protein